MHDMTWNQFRRDQERDDLLAYLKIALKDVSRRFVPQLKKEFSTCLTNGGVESVLTLGEAIHWIRHPVLYSVVTEQFVQARRPRAELTKKERAHRSKDLRRIAGKLDDAWQILIGVSSSPSWCIPIAETLEELAFEMNRLADQDRVPQVSNDPGRPTRIGTPLALALNAQFEKSKLPMTTRCKLIASVVSAFIEPVTGEQIRLRIKDLQRRSRSASRRET